MKALSITLTACATLLATTATAEVSLNSARVGAKDVAALGQFYEAAFGLKEVNRLTLGTGIEIFLNFGATVEAAKANDRPPVVIMPAEPLPTPDPVAHLIFNVTDIAATTAAVTTAAGSVTVAPRAFGNSGLMIAFVKDPAGNLIELIQPPPRVPGR